MNNVALIISTYDDSEDLWKPLEQTYLKYWNDIDFPIYLSTNNKVFDSTLFHSLKIGNELSWSDNLIKSLHSINQDYVLLTFDDLFLTNCLTNCLTICLLFFTNLLTICLTNCLLICDYCFN